MTFIVNPENKIQFVSATPDSVGRSVEEVLRVLDALQTAGPCGCDWKKNDPTIDKLDVVSSVFECDSSPRVKTRYDNGKGPLINRKGPFFLAFFTCLRCR